MKLRQAFRRQKWLYIGIICIILGLLGWVVWLGRGQQHSITSYAECVEAGYPVTESNPPLCRYGNQTFLGPERPEPTPGAVISNINFDILVDGDTKNNIPAHGQTFINSQVEWQAYWRGVHAGLATLPPLIPVNFDTSDVLIVSLGARDTTGFGVRITTIGADTSGTTVNVSESAPTITCTVTRQISNRYLIVRTPKLTEPVKFRITPEKRRC